MALFARTAPSMASCRTSESSPNPKKRRRLVERRAKTAPAEARCRDRARMATVRRLPAKRQHKLNHSSGSSLNPDYQHEIATLIRPRPCSTCMREATLIRPLARFLRPADRRPAMPMRSKTCLHPRETACPAGQRRTPAARPRAGRISCHHSKAVRCTLAEARSMLALYRQPVFLLATSKDRRSSTAALVATSQRRMLQRLNLRRSSQARLRLALSA